VAPTRRIVGIAGHSRTADGYLSALDWFVLGLTGLDRPRVLLLPTASAGAGANIIAFYEAFSPYARASHLKLFGTPDAAEWRPPLVDQRLLQLRVFQRPC
jgi:hypothetical protein